MRWKAACAYDGRYFLGWQSQSGGRTVQDAIETGLQRIFREAVRVHGSARTDAGVHAREQVFHFDAQWRHGADRLQAALGTVLPPAIQIVRLQGAAEPFHARYSARGKRYRYYIHLERADPFEAPFCWSISRDLSIGAIDEAAALLVGQHDFTAFAATTAAGKEDPVKDLRVLSASRRGPRVIITAEGSGFLYKMVRSLVGGLVNVGTGKLPPGTLREILDSRCRTPLIATAPARGLFLEKVFYRRPKHW